MYFLLVHFWGILTPAKNKGSKQPRHLRARSRARTARPDLTITIYWFLLAGLDLRATENGAARVWSLDEEVDDGWHPGANVGNANESGRARGCDRRALTFLYLYWF